jgi:hypothetical protein
LVSKQQTVSKSSGRSLAYTDFRRAVSIGKVYLILAIGISLFISLEFLLTSRAANLDRTVISAIPVLILPVFAVMGSYGALMIFVSDKDKGVYEYLIAYGVNPSKIFWSIVLTSIGLASIILGIDTLINLAIALSSGAASFRLELLIFYVIPISYAVSMFMSMVGMMWSFLAVRRTGINSPVGVISIIGYLPVLAVLVISLIIPAGDVLIFAGSVSLALFIAVGIVIRVSSTKMVRERFLSNA